MEGLVGENNYIELDIRAFEMFDGIITLTAGDKVGTYDLKAYANSESVKADETPYLKEYLLALYNFCREASEYRKISTKIGRASCRERV